MARQFLMTWEGAPAYRWTKMIDGRKLRINCKDLGLPVAQWNKEGSYQAANAWLQSQMPAPQSALHFVKLPTIPPRLVADLPSVSPKGKRPLEVSKNLTDFLAGERARVKPQTFNEIDGYLKKIPAGVLPSSISQINEESVTAHYTWLSSQNWGNAQKNKYLGFFRRFIVWLHEEKRIEGLPANLKSKRHRFKVVLPAVRTFSNVSAVLDSLPARPRLWALLGLNCGMTAVDLGDLNWEQINLKSGTLTRRRIKTEAQASVPTVTYKLWPVTLALLKAQPTKTGFVFVTDTGKPLYETRYVNGKAVKKDLFSTYWNRIEPKPTISLGKFRSIAATELKKKLIYRGFVELFLGHAPDSIADKHYAAETDEPFFEACEFIRESLGIKNGDGGDK